MTWKELLEKAGDKPFIIVEEEWEEIHIPLPDEDEVLVFFPNGAMSFLARHTFDNVNIEEHRTVDWFEEIVSEGNNGCTCDFRGANCWAGCSCGYMEKNREAA